MTGWVAINCVNRSESKISLYSPPLRQKERLRQWLKNINRMSWVPNVCSRLCACHFTEDCFTINRRLKPDAVPTLFGSPGAPSKIPVPHAPLLVGRATIMHHFSAPCPAGSYSVTPALS